VVTLHQGRRSFEGPEHCNTVQETAVGTLAATVERTRRSGSRFRWCVLWVDERGAGLNSGHPQECLTNMRCDISVIKE